jgi:hypothetical protein
VKRLICLIRGHVNAAEMLPEEVFGLYAYSRLYCSRCGRVEHALTPEQFDAAMQRWAASGKAAE